MKRSDFWFFHSFRVRYSEIDAQAVVFNAHYLTYYDTAIAEYFRALDFDLFADATETGVDFHTVRSVVEYKAPVRYDQQIDVGVRTGQIGRSSIRFDLAVFGKDTDDLYTTGEIVWVNTDQTTHKTVPVGEPMRRLLASREPHLEAALQPA